MTAAAVAPAARRTRRYVARAASAVLLLAVAALTALLLGRAAGYQVLIDRSDSMQPAIAAGDLIVTKHVRPAEVRVGDIVTFADASRGGELVTHRVIAKRDKGKRVAVVTRGDANTGVERWVADANGTVGRFAFRIPKLGFFVAWLTVPAIRLLFVTFAAVALGALLLRRIWATGTLDGDRDRSSPGSEGRRPERGHPDGRDSGTAPRLMPAVVRASRAPGRVDAA